MVHDQWQNALDAIPDGAVGVTLSDPPYAPRSMKNFRSADMVQRRDGVVMEFGYGALLPPERRAVAKEIARVTSRWAAVWCDAESDHAWRVHLQRAGMRYVRTSAWLREHGAPQFSGDRPAQEGFGGEKPPVSGSCDRLCQPLYGIGMRRRARAFGARHLQASASDVPVTLDSERMCRISTESRAI